jgi:O-antigen ligase/tetratricopeptide (TPR) repeat protein
MHRKLSTSAGDWGAATAKRAQRLTAADMLLRVVDAGLCGILCAAPFVFGGRHDLGRLVFVSLIAVVSAAWFARQAMLPAAAWHRTAAMLIPLGAAGLLLFQLLPLPSPWLVHLSPRISELLPLWSADNSGPAHLGTWQILSVAPHETVKSLAMLASYGLLFAVVCGRIQDTADVERILNYLAAGVAVMAAFGILQYFTSDGRFFWFFRHPFRTTSDNITGAFINRNHFAGFLVLGIGPLVAWLMRWIGTPPRPLAPRQKSPWAAADRIVFWLCATALAVVVLAILGSRSRGGAIVMLVAGVVLIAVYMRGGLLNARFLYGFIGLATVVVALLSLYGYEEVAARLDDFSEGSLDDIDHGGIRRKIWAANLAAFRSGWLTGAGAGTHSQICPVYLPESLVKEYTHAENGYLQVATETGIIGVVLLAAAIACCGLWCVRCWRGMKQPAEIRAFGAAAAGLAASTAHSLVDFVWYIPACMAGEIVLAACLCRLSHSIQPAVGSRSLRVMPRGRWLEVCAASVVIGAWSIYVYVGPAMAAVHWDRYLRTSVADRELSDQLLSDFVTGSFTALPSIRQNMSEQMLRELQSAVYWDPEHARAHSRLADRFMTEFEHRSRSAANQMDVAQIREAAATSAFASPDDFQAWLNRAFGADVELLRKALHYAHRTVELCPFQGEGYLYLADLCFLKRAPRAAIDAYVDQASRVRPYDKNVLTKCGLQELLRGQPDAALEMWSRCFNTPGSHQGEIVFRLVAAGMPANVLLSKLQPDWRTLHEVWTQYRKLGTPQDLAELLSYAAEVTPGEIGSERGTRPAYVWYWNAMMYADVERTGEALVCLERAYACDPHQYPIRFALAKALLAAGRMPEAEPHVRWCLARRPEDKRLADALVTISKHRLAARAMRSQPPTVPATTPIDISQSLGITGDNSEATQ